MYFEFFLQLEQQENLILSRVELYVKELSWLYFSHLDGGFKCKICELFPHSGVGHLEKKFSQGGMKSMEDHPH